MMSKHATFLLIISLTALVLFFVTNNFFRGYLGSPFSLAKELKSDTESINYKLYTEPPFKYRILFPLIVKSSCEVIFGEPNHKQFYYAYLFWSACFYVSATIMLYALLFTCQFDERQCLLGAIIFLFLPAMLLAYTLPVHTREDTLGYTILFTGLILLLRKEKLLFLLVCLVGVLCRETLLLLPLLYFFYSDDKNLLRRILFLIIPALAWFSLRLIIGFEKYEVWEGLKWNLDNPEQVIGFLFISFNVCWLSFLDFVIDRKYYLNTANYYKLLFYRSAIFILMIVLVTTFLGGIFNEIRLLYLFSPWMIIIFMGFLNKKFEVIKMYVQRKSYWWYTSSVLLFCFLVLYIFLTHQHEIIEAGRYAVPYSLWIVFSVSYIFISLLFLPFMARAKVKMPMPNNYSG